MSVTLDRWKGGAMRGAVPAVATPTELAVAEVYRAQYGRLAGWSARLIGDTDLGRDVATEAFVRLLRQHHEVAEPRAWLYTTAANIIRDHWRKRGRELTAYQRFDIQDRGRTAGPDQSTTLTVREAVLGLPDRLRLVVMLHYFADLTVAQTATHLGKAEGTVKRDLWEARALLATLLEDVR